MITGYQKIFPNFSTLHHQRISNIVVISEKYTASWEFSQLSAIPPPVNTFEDHGFSEVSIFGVDIIFVVV